ncbi:MAG: glycosyltransferase family 2 protein [Fischerella sp. CENA71]|nr:glycosyltransferase family 2 protein [Fischerella sp. CENA71]
MKHNILVSIIINNYNYGEFIAEAINSALEQTYKNIEVIVVDDGSTDNSRKIITSYGKRLVHIFKENAGQPSSYNAGFAASRGEIICFLDSDDIFLTNKIENIVKIFESSEEIGWCFHSIKLIDANHNFLNFTTTNNYISRESDFRKIIKAGKIPPCLPPSSALCFRRSVLEKILPMPTPKTMPCSDHYVKFMAVGLSKGYILGESLTFQRIHDSNMATLRKDKKHMQAREYLFTGLWVKQEFPQFSKFANKIFAVGMCWNQQNGNNDRENSEITQKYLDSIFWHEKIKLQCIILYYYLQDIKNQFLSNLMIQKQYQG